MCALILNWQTDLLVVVLATKETGSTFDLA